MVAHDELRGRTLPRSDLTIERARSKMSGWHFAKEALHPQALEMLAVAEAILGELDRLNGGYTRALLDDEDAAAVAAQILTMHRSSINQAQEAAVSDPGGTEQA